MDDTKRPRQYAAAIAALPTRDARVEALARVPEHLHEWVRFYVAEYFPTLNQFKQKATEALERNAHRQAREIRRINEADRESALQALPAKLRGRVISLLSQWR